MYLSFLLPSCLALAAPHASGWGFEQTADHCAPRHEASPTAVQASTHARKQAPPNSACARAVVVVKHVTHEHPHLASAACVVVVAAALFKLL